MEDNPTLFREQLANVIGAENVITDRNVLEEYSGDQSFVPPGMPLCVLKPRTVSEVQDVVKICNHHRVAVTPYTTGTNNQGAAIPALGGVVIDVSGMNRILEIDSVSRNAHIEAGVTFAQLLDETEKVKTDLAPYGLRVAAPVELPASASVLVSFLEYVPTWTWPRYSADDNNILSMPNFVLPTGELMKTGTAAVPYVRKPYADIAATSSTFINKIFMGAQGTLGIALDGWVMLVSRQEVNKAFFWPFDKVEDAFKPILDIKWLRYGYEMFLANCTELAMLLGESASEVDELRKVLPPWTLIHILRGRADEVEYQEADLKELSSKLGAKIMVEMPGVKNAAERITKEVERPKGWKKTSKYRGARNVMPLITPQKRIPSFNEAVFKAAGKYSYPTKDIGCLAVPTFAEPGVVHYQYSFSRDPEDSKEAERVREMFYETSKDLIELGAFFSRPYGPLAELVYARAGTYHSIVKRFKQMVDPNSIFNPGRLLF